MNLLNGGTFWRFPVVRLVLFVILVAAARLGLTSGVRACGIITHHHISEQALIRIKVDGYTDLCNVPKNHPGELMIARCSPTDAMSLGKVRALIMRTVLSS